MDMGERKKKILSSVVTEYIVSAEPVGSRNIANKYNLGLSSATIRNEMADLEDMGYLEQPHTSAGRVPSDKGYRMYVNELMNDYELSVRDIKVIKSMMELRLNQLDKLITNAAKVLSELTNYTAVFTAPEFKKGAIKTIELVPIDESSMLIILVTNEGIMKNKRVMLPKSVTPEFITKFSNLLKEKLSGLTIEEISVGKIQEIKQAMQTNFEILFPVLDFITDIIDDVNKETEVYLSGTTNIFNYPEYSDIGRARAFLELLDNKPVIKKAISGNNERRQGKKNAISIKIGGENELDALKNKSIITADYYIGERAVGKLGVIGPTRMDYAKAVKRIERISAYMNKILAELYQNNKGD